jgi:hypothetical protein
VSVKTAADKQAWLKDFTSTQQEAIHHAKKKQGK